MQFFNAASRGRSQSTYCISPSHFRSGFSVLASPPGKLTYPGQARRDLRKCFCLVILTINSAADFAGVPSELGRDGDWSDGPHCGSSRRQAGSREAVDGRWLRPVGPDEEWQHCSYGRCAGVSCEHAAVGAKWTIWPFGQVGKTFCSLTV